MLALSLHGCSVTMLERWPQVCCVKITFGLLPTNRFDSTKTVSMKSLCKLEFTENLCSFEKYQPNLNNTKQHSPTKQNNTWSIGGLDCCNLLTLRMPASPQTLWTVFIQRVRLKLGRQRPRQSLGSYVINRVLTIRLVRIRHPRKKKKLHTNSTNFVLDRRIKQLGK